ncbi:unnamed protein product [Nippostrongylus brasiliensis]|uniref:ZM domain-containing protein n=1 Tax=Nippostrongylus brasiliensis TaxID=27835 RepID=A0A0N4YIV2_NIPBR|nr:unnamed protein product [Nippostrongylus brasiliensis]
MGPPPPPPPPPPLKSSATLPSGGWKATQTPRRNNNPIPASSDKTRPTVDSAALQHAAARLRKTGYYEQIRGDVPNLSDGRVAGADQRLPDGNRPYGSQFHQLERDPPREQVHAAPAHSVQSNSIGHIRGHTNPSVNSYSNGEPSLPSSFDAAPKNLYQTYNNPSSKSFNDNKLESPYRSPTAQSYTATNHRTQYQQQQEPIYRNVSPAHAYAPPHYEDQPYAPPTHGTHQNYSSRTQYYATDNDGYNYQNSYSRETRRHEDRPQTRPTEVTLEWESPYVPQSSPILDPHARIREFATTNYIEASQPHNVKRTSISPARSAVIICRSMWTIYTRSVLF